MSTCSPWATIADLCSPCDDYAMDPALLEDSLQFASDVLYELTERRYPGLCADVVRPCCSCAGPVSCRCSAPSEVRLPGYPVVEVTEVKVDGVVVPPEEYRVDDRRWLVGLERADGTVRRWPSAQVLARADTEDRTWSVAYTYGNEPPIGGVKAAASLACQLALACQPEQAGGGKCRLPKRVTTITRQGVTLALLDPMSLFADGLTGLAEVDLWVQSDRYGAKQRRATVVVPGMGPMIRRPGT